jgi:hypothetical protein
MLSVKVAAARGDRWDSVGPKDAATPPLSAPLKVALRMKSSVATAET